MPLRIRSIWFSLLTVALGCAQQTASAAPNKESLPQEKPKQAAPRIETPLRPQFRAVKPIRPGIRLKRPGDAPAPKEGDAPAPKDGDAPKRAGEKVMERFGRTKPVPVSPELRTVVEGENQFAFELYAQLAKREGNLFLSPASISTALTMTYGGAAGETAEQMAGVLHLDLPADKLYPAMIEMRKALAQKSAGAQVNVANRLWGQDTFKFRDDFLTLTRDTFGAELAPLDFVHDAENARKKINDWVATETKDKIQDLLPAGSIDGMTRMVLTNAIYFKGDWSTPFEKEATKPAPFLSTTGAKADAPLMYQQTSLKYAKADGVQSVELPYGDRRLSMVVLLPEKSDGLADLEAKLSVENLAKWTAGARAQKVKVYLPRFKVSAEFALRDTLQALGMTLPFDQNKADFSNMADGGGLFVSSVVHKAVVEVNEQGTEAAAATGVVMAVRSAPIGEPPTFRADHPFVFLIRDNATGSVLFVGRVADPGK